MNFIKSSSSHSRRACLSDARNFNPIARIVGPTMKTGFLAGLSHLLTTALKPWRAARGFRSSDHGEQRLWSTWHRMYDENEHLQARLQVVRQTIREILDSYLGENSPDQHFLRR